MAYRAEATQRAEFAERLTLREFTRRHLNREKTKDDQTSRDGENAYAAHVALVMEKLKD